jgi:hypothetical protein
MLVVVVVEEEGGGRGRTPEWTMPDILARVTNRASQPKLRNVRR